MTTTQNTVFEIPKDGYLAFDALSMKQLINENLSKTGVFTDQNYEASYLSNVINIIAYSYSALMFYLNKTSTENMFTEAQIYENMNRIVKMLGYNPIGFQTSLLPFILQAQNLTKGLYLIPRYSYFVKNDIAYSFNEDIIFNKAENNVLETLTEVNKSKVLYQGRFYEYPPFTATGEDNEIFTLTVGDTTLIDHFNIFVYRYDSTTNLWEQWSSTENLYLEQSNSKKYELRLNPDQNYEIKFGNNINGLKLNENDQIIVYYLQSNAAQGEVASGAINNATYVRFFTTTFNSIFNDVNTVNASLVLNSNSLKLTNTSASTRSKSGESPDQIRESAPNSFKSQYRLVTSNDYKSFVLNNFANFIQDVNISNNWDYIATRLKYYYDLGLTKPDLAGAPLFAQVNFADSCNFNNIYITAVPKINITRQNPSPGLSTAQKQIIISTITPRKPLTSEIVILDPVYIGADLGLPSGDITTLQDINNTSLLVVKKANSKRTDDDIKADIVNVFKETFDQNSMFLGKTVSVLEIKSKILTIQGIQQIYTINNITGSRASGLSFYVFDPIYPNQIQTESTEIQTKNFQFLYFYDLVSLPNRIIFEQQSSVYQDISE